jgi:hypothetical protein
VISTSGSSGMCLNEPTQALARISVWIVRERSGSLYAGDPD